MHKFTNTLTPAQVDRFAVDFRQPYLKLHAAGKVVLSVLFAAAVRIPSIHETRGRLAKAPCEEIFTSTTCCLPQPSQTRHQLVLRLRHGLPGPLGTPEGGTDAALAWRRWPSLSMGLSRQ